MSTNLKTKLISSIDHVRTGESMRKARIASGLSLREVARRMGFSAPFVSDLEKGRRCWTEEKARKYNESIGSNWNEAITES